MQSQHEEVEDSEGRTMRGNRGAEDERAAEGAADAVPADRVGDPDEEVDVEVGEEEDEAQVEYDLDGYYAGAGEAEDDEHVVVVVDDDEDVESFGRG